MKIAIIAPSPVPFTIGGAEKLWWGLLNAINQAGEHQAELIKIPSPERNFGELMASYRHFSELDLTHFDRVISTKYPAWMVSHPDHHCYLQHKLRGLYDTYHFTGKSIELPPLQAADRAELKQLYQLLGSKAKNREVLVEFWGLWEKLEKLFRQDMPEKERFAFPGALTRSIVHFLDDIALQPGSIKRYSAISNNITNRADYFPENVPVHVIHHPSDLSGFHTSSAPEGPYIFTISRLDRPKRLDLLIQAFKKTKADIRFRIAGEGPEQQQLEQLAKSDSRIQFIGRISDQQVIQEYAGALFIPFIPYDEDYGLITIEAMKSQKAVLTTTDAGGVNEFVEQGVSGYSVAADVESLADAMNKLINNPLQTIAMGEQALKKVAHIDWKNTQKKLIQKGDVSDLVSVPSKGLDIVVALTFSCWPPRGGGQIRVYNLYKELAREHRVTLLALINPGELRARHGEQGIWQDQMIAPGLREICIAKTPEQIKYQLELESDLNASISDIACIQGHSLTPQYGQVLSVLARSADIFVVSHPYLYHAVKEHWQGELWYEAHNVEIDLKKDILGGTAVAKQWLQQVSDVEAACCESSQEIITCSQQDARRISTLYGQSLDKIKVVPNGVAMILDAEHKNQLIKSGHNSQQAFISLFMGSWHGPNIEAAELTIKMAKQVPDVQFLIMGSVCLHDVCKDMPKNCYSVGMVSESEKNLYLQLADIAINPMLSGSGTNLKMLDYAANGLPILSTEFGLRGLDFIKDQEVLVAPVADFAAKLAELHQNRQRKEQQERLKQMAVKAKYKTQQQYQWCQIAQLMKNMLEKHGN